MSDKDKSTLSIINPIVAYTQSVWDLGAQSTPLFAPGRVAPPYVGPATRRRRSPCP